MRGSVGIACPFRCPCDGGCRGARTSGGRRFIAVIAPGCAEHARIRERRGPRRCLAGERRLANRRARHRHRTETNHRVTLGCELQSQYQADQSSGQALPNPSSGRFLLQCGVYEQAVLDVRTGQTQLLPDDLSHYWWRVAGTDYAESPNTGCGGYDKCFALYDLATGAISVRRAPAIVDLDRPGAPTAPLCPALRRRILAAKRAAAPSFAYERGLFVHAAKRAGYIEIDRCKRPPIVLSGRGEPRNFDLSAGLLTWDTGYPTSGIDEEGESPYPSVLNAYQLATRRRRSWRLPARVLPGETRPVVFGYSTHTSQTVFWIADRSVNYGKTGLIVETSSIYSARF